MLLSVCLELYFYILYLFENLHPNDRYNFIEIYFKCENV